MFRSGGKSESSDVWNKVHSIREYTVIHTLKHDFHALLHRIFLSERVPSTIVYPERAIPKWFNYRNKKKKVLVDLPKVQYNDNFLG